MKLIYFYSKTCKTCRQQEAEFEAHVPSQPMRRVEITSEAAPCLMRKYKIMDVPTTLLTDDCDNAAHYFIDFHTTADIEDWIARH